ncbi:MAG TPA: hypothetical protein VF516_03150 [Kofleriaceae bacterium]
MNPLALLPAWAWRWIAIAGVGLACAAYGAFKMHEHDQIAYNELAQQFGEFKGAVKATGEKAEKDRLAKEAADKENKEKADAKNAADLAALSGMLDRARRRPVSAPAACPADPSGADRFRAESERAYRDLVEGLRGEGERGSKAVIGLNTAKRWAQAPPK